MLESYLDADGQPRPGVNRYLRQDRSINELIGLARGVMADGALTVPEVDQLVRWLDANQDACAYFPANVLAQRLERILADRIIDGDEIAELEDVLRELMGESNGHVIGRNMATTLPLDTPPPAIEFPGRTFCLTGKFAFGPRKVCEAAVVQRGARAIGSVTRAVDYLVIGTVGSRDWIHSSFGRKIEEAVALRDAGRYATGIRIVGEDHWADWLMRVG